MGARGLTRWCLVDGSVLQGNAGRFWTGGQALEPQRSCGARTSEASARSETSQTSGSDRQTDRQTDVRSLQIPGQGWAGVSLLSLGTGVHQIGLAGQGFGGEGWRGHLSGPKLRGHRDEREKSSVDGTLELCVRLVQFWIRGFGDLEWSLLEGLLSVVVPSTPHISPTNKIL